MLAEEIDEAEALGRASAPLRAFMLRQVRPDDVALFVEIARQEPPASPDDVSLRVLLPAFMISELRRAFEIGFLVFIPFLVIDMVVASVLMSMGMMMLPPVMVSLPVKLIFFVLVDGWALVVGSLVQSFGQA
jgi:flagellar biosynthesis protein FliP